MATSVTCRAQNFIRRRAEKNGRAAISLCVPGRVKPLLGWLALGTGFIVPAPAGAAAGNSPEYSGASSLWEWFNRGPMRELFHSSPDGGSNRLDFYWVTAFPGFQRSRCIGDGCSDGGTGRMHQELQKRSRRALPLWALLPSSRRPEARSVAAFANP